MNDPLSVTSSGSLYPLPRLISQLFSCCFCKISAMMKAVGFGHPRPGLLLGETRCPPGGHSVGIGRPEEPAGLGWGKMEGAAAILLPKGSLASFSQPCQFTRGWCSYGSRLLGQNSRSFGDLPVDPCPWEFFPSVPPPHPTPPHYHLLVWPCRCGRV